MQSDIIYYFPPNPPYFLCIAALVASIASGVAFYATLVQLAKEWQANRSSRTLLNLKGISIQLPYLGISIGVGIFLASGLEVFGFPPNLSYPTSISLTVGIGYFIWRQLGKMLVELEKGGSAAMDLDIFDT